MSSLQWQYFEKGSQVYTGTGLFRAPICAYRNPINSDNQPFKLELHYVSTM